MRKLATLAILVAAGIYATGYLSLNQTGVTTLLTQMEDLSSQGDVDGVCALFHDDLKVSLDDRTPEAPMKLTGGKPELCAYMQQVLPLQAKFVASTTIERDNFTLSRDLAHPWTVHVSYRERRNDTLKQPAGKISSMQSKDQLTVVQTLGGRKIMQVDSVSAALSGVQI